MESKEPTNEKIIQAVKSYYGLKIDDNAWDNADVYAYEETTVDGYSVWVVTHDMKSISILFSQKRKAKSICCSKWRLLNLI